MSDPLRQHFERMQDMAARYLEPRPYAEIDGTVSHTIDDQRAAFISDMIYMLDGPEQRAAQYGESE